MKTGARVLGIDDASFEFEDNYTFVNGVIYRGTEFIENIESLNIEIDGNEATEKIVKLFENCRNHKQIKAILTDGISFGGFNIIDLEEIAETTGKPVIAVTDNQPDKEKFLETLEKYSEGAEKVRKLEEPKEVELEAGKAYIQFSGVEAEKAVNIVRGSVLHGKIPEAIRVAHMIGRAQRNLV